MGISKLILLIFAVLLGGYNVYTLNKKDRG